MLYPKTLRPRPKFLLKFQEIKEDLFKSYNLITLNISENLNKKILNNQKLPSILISYIIKRPQKHNFHIVSPSPWPFLTSIAAFIFVMGMVFFMHSSSNGPFILKIGVLSIIVSMILWFRDIIREGTFMGYHSLAVQFNLRLGFLLFIVSEVMFFFAFFWAYFHVSLCPSVQIGCSWPPAGFTSFLLNHENILSPYFINNSDFINNFHPMGSYWSDFQTSSSAFYSTTNFCYLDDHCELGIENFGIIDSIIDSAKSIFEFSPADILIELFSPLLIRFSEAATITAPWWETVNTLIITMVDSGVLIDPFSIPLANTIILLSSGALLTLSHNYLMLGNFTKSHFFLKATVIFGLFFFFFQLVEYTYASFSLNDGIYGTTFYMLTGFHGFHVLIGTIFLIVCFFRALLQHFTSLNHFGFEAAIWYWHFVDVVWIFLFFFVYMWPNEPFFRDTAVSSNFTSNSVKFDDDFIVHMNSKDSLLKFNPELYSRLLPPFLEIRENIPFRLSRNERFELVQFSLKFLNKTYFNSNSDVDFINNLIISKRPQ